MTEPTTRWENLGPVRLAHADCRQALAELAAGSVDAIVTDPPYGLEFMGKDWDRPWAVSPTNKVGYDGRQDNLTLPTHRDNRNANCRRCGGRARGAKTCICDQPDWDRSPAEDMVALQLWFTEIAVAAHRVLKPGGYLLAFGGTRTAHRIAAAIEDAGFEIRDSIIWMYGQGFPKSLDVSKAIDKAAGATREVVGQGKAGASSLERQRRVDLGHRPNLTKVTPEQYPITAPATDDARQWEGWGTALKPAHEPIIMARKPLGRADAPLRPPLISGGQLGLFDDGPS